MVRSMIAFAAVLAMGNPLRADDDQGSATLPLSELLRLHAEADLEQVEEEAPPPVGSTVEAFDVEARIIGNAIEAVATVRIAVFEDGWVRVPILPRQSGLQITDLPSVEKGSVVSDEDWISFLTSTSGTYELELGFVKSARRGSSGWELDLRLADAVIQRLSLAHDHGLFEVDDSAARRDGERLVMFARDGRFTVSWKTLRSQSPAARSRAGQPPIDPVIHEGVASIVVTLDGQRISRYRYGLRFQGAQEIEVAIPDGQELSKVHLDGVSQALEMDGSSATLTVVPSRPGEQSAVVELLITEQTEPLALAGQLQFALPTLSWRMNELQVTLHLPNVFNYSWVGGSLSPGELLEVPRYTLDVPTPGKVLSVHQQLVHGLADVQVDYAVDLTEKYFR